MGLAVPAFAKKKGGGQRSPYFLFPFISFPFPLRTYLDVPLLSFLFVHCAGNTFTNEYAYNFYSNASKNTFGLLSFLLQKNYWSDCLVVVSLLGLTATEELDTGALLVDLGEELVDIGLGAGLGLLDRLVNLDTGSLVNGLHLILGDHVELQETLLQASDGVVVGTHVLDLLTGTVSGTGVGHGVTTITVGLHLEQKRSLARDGPLLGVGNSLVNGQDIHSVDLLEKKKYMDVSTVEHTYTAVSQLKVFFLPSNRECSLRA